MNKTDSTPDQEITFSTKPWLADDYLPPNPFPGEWAVAKEEGVVVTTLESLQATMRAGPGRELWNGKMENEQPALVAAPGMSHLVPLMEVPELRSAVLEHDMQRLRASRKKAVWFGMLAVPVGVLMLIIGASVMGLIMVVVGAAQLYAWYTANKALTELGRDPDAYCARLSADARFVLWTYLHPTAPRRGGVGWSRVYLMLGGWTLVALAQVAAASLYPEKNAAIQAAALVKSLAASEPWRLLTGTMMHGGVFHFLMNMSAAVSFIALVERTAQRRLVALLWLTGALVGSLASVLWSANTSVGASGGILAWLGFALVMAQRRREVLPADFRQSMLTNLGLMVLIGIAGWGVVDNAAHLGGLMAGGAIAAWVFREEKGDLPLADTPTVRWVGRASEAVFVLLTVFTLMKIFRLF